VALRFLRLTFGTVLLASALPAPAFRKIVIDRPPQPNAPAGGVPLPHTTRDQFGVMWDVQADGTIGDGGDDLYDGAARLMVNETGFEGQQSATFDATTGELAFAPQAMGGLQVSRRVAVNPAAGWCRFTETLTNQTNVGTRARVHLQFDMGAGIQNAEAVVEPRKKTTIGVAVFDGRRAIAMLGGGRGGAVVGRYAPQPNSDQCDLVYELEIPAGKTVSVVHFQAVRPSTQQSVDFMLQAKEKDLLSGLPKAILRTVVNFRRADPLAADIDLPRAPLQDIVELHTGDQYRGALADGVFTLESFHGKVEVPVERIIGVINAGRYQPQQLLILTDGQIIGGKLPGDTLNMTLSSGQKTAIPLSAIRRIGCRKRPGEPEEIVVDKPTVVLRDGQRLIITPPEGPIAVSTLYGELKLPTEAIAFIGFADQEQQQPLHQIVLRDGSKFSALVAGEVLPLPLRLSASQSSPPVRVAVSQIARLQLLPGELETPDNGPSLLMLNGDELAGVATGTVEVKTGFDVLKLNAAEIRYIRPVEPPEGGKAIPGEVTMALWGGATVSGRIVSESLEVLLGSGVKVRVPVASIERYDQPQPAAPAPMVEQIRAIVEQLSDPDWKKREEAARQLQSLGISAVRVLRELRDGQPPEAQKQIDTILKSIADADAARQQSGGAGQPILNKDGQLPELDFNKDQLLVK